MGPGLRLIAMPHPYLPFNGRHPREPCNYMDRYSFIDPGRMEGWVGLIMIIVFFSFTLLSVSSEGHCRHPCYSMYWCVCLAVHPSVRSPETRTGWARVRWRSGRHSSAPRETSSGTVSRLHVFDRTRVESPTFFFVLHFCLRFLIICNWY